MDVKIKERLEHNYKEACKEAVEAQNEYDEMKSMIKLLGNFDDKLVLELKCTRKVVGALNKRCKAEGHYSRYCKYWNIQQID